MKVARALKAARSASDPSKTPSKASVSSSSAGPPYNATILKGNESSLMHECLAKRSWWRPTPEGEKYSFWWGGNGQHFDWEAGYSADPKQARQQLVCRFRRACEVCTKPRLAVNLRRYAREAKIDLGSLIPLTFVVNAGDESNELSRFKTTAASLAGDQGESIWIVKPRNQNRGIGIEVCQSAKAVEAHLKKRKKGSEHIVQKYIERPLLLRGRKFDIRQFVLVTPDLQVFMYRDSYVRTCSTAYDAANVADKSMHLTNDFVQKFLPSYGQHEDANKLSFAELQAILDETPTADGRRLSVADDLWPGMLRCVQAVFACALPHYPPASVGSGPTSFEVYGLDFMVDDEGKVFLLEVNTSPALFRHGAWLTEMLPRMVEELFQKAIDPHFPPPPGATAPEPMHKFERVDVPPLLGAGARGGAAAAAEGAKTSLRAALAHSTGGADVKATSLKLPALGLGRNPNRKVWA